MRCITRTTPPDQVSSASGAGSGSAAALRGPGRVPALLAAGGGAPPGLAGARGPPRGLPYARGNLMGTTKLSSIALWLTNWLLPGRAERTEACVPRAGLTPRVVVEEAERIVDDDGVEGVAPGAL